MRALIEIKACSWRATEELSFNKNNNGKFNIEEAFT